MPLQSTGLDLWSVTVFKFGIYLFSVTVLGQIFLLSLLPSLPSPSPILSFFFLFSPPSLLCSCSLSLVFSLTPFLSLIASLALVLSLSLFLSSSFSFSLLRCFLRKSSYQKSKLLTDIQCYWGRASRALRVFTYFPAVCTRVGGALKSLRTIVSLQNVDVNTFLFCCFIHLCNRDLLRVFYVPDARLGIERGTTQTWSPIFIYILERRQRINT